MATSTRLDGLEDLSGIQFGGRSVLNISSNTFQEPSGCFFHTVRYFPLSEAGFPDAS